jgi:hypothetical protein
VARASPGDRPVVLDADEEKPAVPVGQADGRLDQLVVAQRPVGLALELDGEALAGRDEPAQLIRGHRARL